MSLLARWGAVIPSGGIRRTVLAVFAVALIGGAGTAIAVAEDDPPAAGEEAPADGDAAVVYDEAQVEAGLQVYKEGGCRACHGWAANGVREGENPQGPSLRASLLTPELLRLTIACGRPGAIMPRYDQQAYNMDGRCYGIDRFNVGDMQLPPRGRTNFSQQQLDDIVVYLMARVVGLPNQPTYDECLLFFGDEAPCDAIFR